MILYYLTNIPLDSLLSADAPEFVPSFQKKPTIAPDSGNVGVQMLHQPDIHHPAMNQQPTHHGEYFSLSHDRIDIQCA